MFPVMAALSQGPSKSSNQGFTRKGPTLQRLKNQNGYFGSKMLQGSPSSTTYLQEKFESPSFYHNRLAKATQDKFTSPRCKMANQSNSSTKNASYQATGKLTEQLSESEKYMLKTQLQSLKDKSRQLLQKREEHHKAIHEAEKEA
jgi:hypothetical protein